MKFSKKIFWFLFLFLTPVFIFGQKNNYVILISFDGFRWDYANRGITPNIDYIKKQGVSASSFQPCFPSKTFPNHQSIITGMYIENHGIISNSFNDPFTGERYSLGDDKSTSQSKWYLGEPFWETAKRNGIKTASFFWPGSELDLKYRRPDYVKHYNKNFPYFARVDTIIKWLSLPQSKRPHFITLYFSLTDTYGHLFGPNSPQVNHAIASLDSVLGYLFLKIKAVNMIDSVNVILVSDHGMTEVSDKRIINIGKLLRNFKCKLQNSGPFMMVTPPAGKEKAVYSILKKNEKHYKVYLKNNIPEYFHFKKNPFISKILIVADLGWTLLKKKTKKYSLKGNHGYDNHLIDMHGIFFAIGHSFKNGYRTGTILNIDVYPLLCKIFGIAPRGNIDGKLERISFILK